ncbi:IQ calmodulin-binding motif family protein [Tritrichomonas foetus]|uniref:IQ calmodulin-binding motif family protein n=1 Tax=Tritrichomonas foetus TaxID=1144522 RepID=A0A1J4JXC5_9EUKA|nr:IQ calmodulin-binding motif family protein [Tritrichomonas foetus]|eukprot:OHT02188.1 IQ calmodulin-binding motif family protein [Tritrichomonas foetus]
MRGKQARVINQRPTDIGTFNPAALEQPIFQKHLARNSAYEELAQLSNMAENLQKSNVDLRNKLNKYIEEESTNPFCQYKKYALSLSKQISQRETELNDFSEHFRKFRESTDPTFVEINASYVRTPNYDPITVSLLVSNKQKKFFNSKDIKEQNEALKYLISKQKEHIAILNGRLKVFNQFQSENSIKTALESLKRGGIPGSLAGVIPTLSVELRAKHKMLSNELSTIVQKRREVHLKLIEKKLMKRELRNLNRNAVIIQRIFRGYILRKKLMVMQKSAKIIQTAVRGFLARFNYKQILQKRKEEEENEEEEQHQRKTRKVAITAQNSRLLFMNAPVRLIKSKISFDSD